MSLRLWVCLCLLSFALGESFESFKFIAPNVRGLLNRRTRRLLAPSTKQGGWEIDSNGDTCLWDASASTCVVSRDATVKHLQDSDSAYAKLIANFGACAEHDAEDSCNDQGCLWDGFVDFRIGHEKSPCLTHVPATAASLVAGATCAVYTTNLECYQHPECDWDQEELECQDDGFQFYFGVNSNQFRQATDAVIAYKTQQLIPIFAKEFDFSAKDFDWQKVIDWKPKSGCPTWSDPLFCTYADAILEYAGQGFYCGARYSRGAQFKQCRADPLCEFRHSDMTCIAPDAHYAPGGLEGLKRIAKAIEHEGDKEYIETTLACNSIGDKQECIKREACQWNANDNECDVHGTWIAELIGSPGKDGSDAVCMLARAYAESGCLDKTELEGPEACRADPNCEIRTDGDCYGSPKYLLNYALEHDTDLKSSYGSLQSRCKKYRKKRQCQRAPTYRSMSFID